MKMIRFTGMPARPLFLLTGLLLLLVACSSEEKALPPLDEPASQARVTVTGTGLFKV